MTQDSVSEELVTQACDAYGISSIDPFHRVNMRAVLHAIAPRLKAEGMREAATLTSPRIDKAVKDGTDNYVAVQLRNIILARAQELDPK